MGTSYGASNFSGLTDGLVLWAPLSGNAITTTAKTVTTYGNATQSTAILDPWGLARPVGYFDGTGDYLAVGAIGDFYYPTQNFTIEAFIYVLNNAKQMGIYNNGHGGNGYYYGIRFESSIENKPCVYLSSSGNSAAITLTSSTTFSTGWNHIAVVRSSLTRWDLYLNGISVASSTTNITLYNGQRVPIIGLISGTEYLYGYVSEFRISNTARYTAAFTPPDTRFKPDSYTKLLLHMYGSGATFVDDPFIDYDCYPVLPSGVTATNNGAFTKSDLGNNQSVLNFDGSTNCINIGTISTFNFLHQVGTTGKWGIAFWYKWTNRTSTICILNTAYGSVQHGAYLRFNSRNPHVFIARGTTGQPVIDASTISMLPNDSIWHHLVINWDQSLSSNTASIYCDGSFFEGLSKNSYTPSASDASYAMQICKSLYTDVPCHFQGQLKDLMIWKDRVLSLTEIKLLMNRTHPITGRGLMPVNGKYWRLS